MSADSYPFADLTLARRLEGAEAHANRRFVEARASLKPESGATWCDVDGAFAMFDGVGSPLTQTFGLGMTAPLTPAALDTLEEFFRTRGAELFHEVSPLADPSVFALLSERGYEPFEFTSVMYRPCAQAVASATSESPSESGPTVRLARTDEAARWAATGAEGWSEYPELAAFMLDMGDVSAHTEDGYCFFAELSGTPIATGLALLRDGVVLLAGASTVPSGRKQGAQRALLHARLAFAERAGADLAMMCAQPGSASQRNAERHGFRIAYTRIKWRMRPPANGGA